MLMYSNRRYLDVLPRFVRLSSTEANLNEARVVAND
jgi:hypothetical protein